MKGPLPGSEHGKVLPDDSPTSDRHPLRVRGLPLPALLADLLDSGQWQHPGDGVLRRALPWFEGPLTFLTSTLGMEANTRGLDREADDDWSSRYFHVMRGTGARHLGLPWLDSDLAVLIAINMIPGEDLGIALDYRGKTGTPAVVASDVWTYPQCHLWRPVAASFEEFALKLGIAPAR